MLIVTQDAVLVKLLHFFTVYNMLQLLACDGGKRHRSVIGSLMSVSLLEYWHYQSILQVIRYNTGVE